MARKRKSRATATPQEPQHVLPTEPEHQPELVPEEVQEGEREPEMELESEPEPSQAVEALEEDPGVEEQEVEEEENTEEEEEENTEEEEEEDDDGITENTEGQKDDDVSTEPATNEQESETKVKPSEIVDNGGETGCQNEEGEDELEEEPLEKLLEPFSKDQLTVLIKEAVAKHPDIMENVHQFADSDPAHCKIFVHGLGWEANAETITSVFGKYGQIEDCKVVKDKNSGKSKGYGFILFKHRDGARRALKQPQKLIEGRMTSCQLASAGPVQSTPPPPVVAAVPSPSVSEYTQRKIYVSNVSAEIDPKKLFEFFSRFGEIEEGPLGLDKQSGKPRGFCLFVYRTFESAKKALEEPHKHFDGQILHCQKAIDGPKHSRGNFNQPHGLPQQQHQQHHHQGHQGFYHPAKKGRYAGSSGAGHTSGHLMAPSAGPGVPVGFNPAVAPAAIGQAVAALLATQGAGFGIGNLLGGIGAGVNPQGVPPMMNNAGYGGPGGAGGYGGQAGMQGGYGGQPQMGPGAVRPHQGGAPYMGHGH